MRSAPLALALLTGAAALGAQALRVALVGDSTVNDQGGWGPGFAASFGPGVECANYAKNGRSSKSFRDEGLWEPVLSAKPQYVIIQFGHNDGPGKGPERETDPATTFRANLARYAGEVIASGGVPVFATSIVRRKFDGAGKIVRDSLVPYVEEVRRLAAERKIPLIDLYALTLAQSESVGPAGTEGLGARDANGKLDTTHLGPLGQRDVGVLAAREIVGLIPALQPRFHELIAWNEAMRQPRDWYSSPEAVRIAGNLLAYQHDNGGWEKNIDMALPLGEHQRAALAKERGNNAGRTTIDNDATYTQMRYLARVHAAAGDARLAAAVNQGLHYLLEAQYPNGGWPQFYPLRKGYYTHITYNDDAMTGVLETLRAIADRHPEYSFVTEVDRERCRDAIQKGIECILKTQVAVNGKLTAWCAQHDEETFAPAKARSYELVSLSGSESVGVVQFLMGIDRPSPEIIRAVQSAIAWFTSVELHGIREQRRDAPGTPKGFDKVVVADPAAPPLWARFYEIGTNRPMFCGRDGIVKYDMSEIEYERRNGYRWYVDRPAKLLSVDYPKWMAQWAPGKDARMTLGDPR